MCNRAVSLIANVVESYGVPTVSLSINRTFSEKIPTSRAGFLKFPYGAPFGEPSNNNQQMAILRDLLVLLQEAQEPGTLVDLPHRWKRTQYSEVDLDSFIVNK